MESYSSLCIRTYDVILIGYTCVPKFHIGGHPYKRILLTPTFAYSWGRFYECQLMTPTSAYLYACLYQCHLLTPCILIFCDNLFKLFTLNLHHNIIKSNQQKIFLGNFSRLLSTQHLPSLLFQVFFQHIIFICSLSTLVHIPTFYTL